MMDISGQPVKLPAESYENDDIVDNYTIAQIKFQLMEEADGECQWKLCVFFDD